MQLRTSKCFPTPFLQQISASLLKESFARAKEANLRPKLNFEMVCLALDLRKQFFIDSGVDQESNVNQAVLMKPSVIHASNSVPKDLFSKASTFQFPNVTLNTNTPPPIMLRENSQVPESKKIDISAIPDPSPTVLTEPDLTTAGGAPLVDVEMADGSQSDELAKAPT